MRETIRRFRCEAGRFKFVSAIAAIFLAGALLSLGASAWYYSSILRDRVAAYDRQVARLTGEIDDERRVNRDKLDRIADRVSAISKELSETAETARVAASTARSAATTAKGAAKNAAQAGIRAREVPAKPKRIVTREVEP